MFVWVVLLLLAYFIDLVVINLVVSCRMIFCLTPFLHSFGDWVYKVTDCCCYTWDFLLCMVCCAEALAGQQYIGSCFLYSGLVHRPVITCFILNLMLSCSLSVLSDQFNNYVITNISWGRNSDCFKICVLIIN